MFVGRERELNQLHDAYTKSLLGHGALAMVIGEPGIGKTALCEALANYVAKQRGRTLVGHCYEEGSVKLPYLPITEALGSYVLSADPDDLHQDLASGAEDIARIVPEIREKLSMSPRPASN